ncbi:hypothetical protein JJL56_01175 [Azospirillum sp. YIM DDC1]|uniref:Uncharacterized protein n=1 Tax=Azospirillum aestuarii TaxID=2802052 RepID=A0ABS1HRM2_9PROT|nr:hypothetical protein [Azospirillum aestuarii]MBK4717472.1 hypothetical protein [Azospirillum aestuarii]
MEQRIVGRTPEHRLVALDGTPGGLDFGAEQVQANDVEQKRSFLDGLSEDGEEMFGDRLNVSMVGKGELAAGPIQTGGVVEGEGGDIVNAVGAAIGKPSFQVLLGLPRVVRAGHLLYVRL